MNITIHNLKDEQPLYPWDIKIDRTSYFGNPFYMTNETQRAYVCNQFKKFLQMDTEMLSHLKAVLLLYKKYGKLRLFCWCAPKQCHGEPIIKKLEEMMNEESNK